MIKVGDKVVVTEVPEGFGLFGIEVGSVGEVVNRVDKTCVDILFGDGKKFLGFIDEEEYLKSKNYGHTHVFLVEKFYNEEEEEDMLEVGDKVVVTEVLHDTLVDIEVGKVGEIIAVDYSDYTKMPYLINFGDFTLWSGREFLVEKVDNKKEKEVMLKVGDKVVVTKVLDGGLDGVEVGRVGKICEVDYNEDSMMPYRVDFGDYKWWAGKEFIVEKLEDVETGETQSEGEIKGAEIQHSVNVKGGDVVEALTVEEAIKSYIEENKCGIKPKEVPTTDNEDTFKVGEDDGEGSHTNVRGSSLASQNMPINGFRGFALEETETYIEDKQDTKEYENTPEEGAYNTVIKKDGLTVYTNYSVEVVGEVMRVGGVDDLVSNFDESEEG